ncbi:hypothetical protein D8B22_13690 [Verminephrobacter aporrectodeae subsp. tuberculatae]|uniref:hypothetical protein n=1 Tax=Verminephrobacter aporrectodeae TaxID=1110389 RepID=UPI002243CDCE|nr:hypothetical protein [Verminephrobacter aporrectodeae]MCW8166151.1 hypothetical protein [Verminephrobacter aporrectodeae subsp. tuberculatae]MCW8170135.1 hypothetical protein [Verminephrobacter aporrectodeae subsp. tuberculatae]
MGTRFNRRAADGTSGRERQRRRPSFRHRVADGAAEQAATATPAPAGFSPPDGSIAPYEEEEKSLRTAESNENDDVRAFWSGLFALLFSGALIYLALSSFIVGWPKWLRFSLLIVGLSGMIYMLNKAAELIKLIWYLFLWLLLACALLGGLYGIGWMIWEDM